MRTIRLAIAVLLAMSLTILPVSAAMNVGHVAKAEMSMGASGDDCACCNATKKCLTDICMFKCYNAPAISVEGMPSAQPLPQPYVAIRAAFLSPFSTRPDPPPPRS